MSLHEIQRVLEERDPVARLGLWLELSEPEQRAAARLAEQRRHEVAEIMTNYDEEVARVRRAYNVARSMGYKGGPPKILAELERRAAEAKADETPRRSED